MPCRHAALAAAFALVAALACVPEVPAAAPQADVVVAPGGDDAGPGTAAAPLATPARARDAVRQRIAAGLKAPVTVLLRGGTYRLTEPVVFGPQDGGTAACPVTYAAWPGETPVLSGGRVITGWKAAADGTWQVVLPEVKSGAWTFRELFVGGERRPRARHPNDGFLRVAKVVDDRRSFQYAEGDLPPLGDVGRAELLLLHDWSVSYNLLASVDAPTRTVATTEQIGGEAAFWRINGFEPNPRYRIENHRALLDAPGEWFLDEAAGTLTYKPMPGEKPETVEAVAPVAPQLLVVRGDAKAGRYVEQLHFKGLVLRHCAWTFKERYAGGQACFHWQGPPTKGWKWGPVTPAVEFEAARDCTFEGGVLEHLGGSGVWIGRATRGCKVVGSRISDVSGNGVMVGDYGQRQGDDVTRATVISNNLVETCGQQFFGAVGVWVGLAEGTEVVRNTVRRHPYTGVSVGWQWNPTPTQARANVVSANHMHDCMLVLSDGGCIYTLGLQPGSRLEGNLIHDVPKNAGRAESNGMFLDEGTTDFLISGNLIYATDRSPFRFHKAGKNMVRGNTVTLPAGVPLVRFNNTPQENISAETNTEVPADQTASPAVQQKIKDMAARTGPEAAWRKGLGLE
jgi:hypothetical protein